MLPEEAKHQSLRVMKHALATDEEYSKQTIKGTRLEAVENIREYQDQTRKWRDSHAVRKQIQDGDLILRRKPMWLTQERSNQSGKVLTRRRLPEDQGRSI
jgi:hypothetical protein